MSAVDLLQKAVRLDANGRMLEALKLYQSGIDELLKVCKGKLTYNTKEMLRFLFPSLLFFTIELNFCLLS